MGQKIIARLIIMNFENLNKLEPRITLIFVPSLVERKHKNGVLLRAGVEVLSF